MLILTCVLLLVLLHHQFFHYSIHVVIVVHLIAPFYSYSTFNFALI